MTRHDRDNGEERLSRWDDVLLAICGVLLLVLTVAAFVKENRAEWRRVQAEARAVVAERLGPEAAAAVPAGIQQIWIQGLHNTVDRCITCHVGIDWEGLEDAPQPFARHPYPEILESHPVEKYGCTSCHSGQGYALETDAAHGDVPPAEWPWKLLGREVRERYGLDNRYGAVEIRCNKCHRYEQRVEGMELINLAKELVNRTGCQGCHIIDGEGGAFGPKLDRVGDKFGEHFDFSRIQAEHPTVALWHLKHFENPQKVSRNSIMTRMAFSERDRKALTLLVLSWVRDDVPREYFPYRRLASGN